MTDACRQMPINTERGTRKLSVGNSVMLTEVTVEMVMACSLLSHSALGLDAIFSLGKYSSLAEAEPV